MTGLTQLVHQSFGLRVNSQGSRVKNSGFLDFGLLTLDSLNEKNVTLA
ncbi:hypothetical protein FDUTEX481_09027 [Tolypothrix sp. PCC 7601]|nr:hypothetical protein FDUTEX481_09027 [Tolypothrix sp. PCC 7601]